MGTRTGVGIGLLSLALVMGAGCASREVKKEEVRQEPAAPSAAEVVTATEEGALGLEEATAFCVRLHEQMATCPREFISLLLDLRAQRDPRFAGVFAREGVREAMTEEGVKEVLADGTGPLEPRQARCTEYAANGPPVPSGDPQRAEPCYALSTCEERVSCLQPVLEQRLMDGRGRARSGAEAQ